MGREDLQSLVSFQSHFKFSSHFNFSSFHHISIFNFFSIHHIWNHISSFHHISKNVSEAASRSQKLCNRKSGHTSSLSHIIDVFKIDDGDDDETSLFKVRFIAKWGERIYNHFMSFHKMKRYGRITWIKKIKNKKSFTQFTSSPLSHCGGKWNK